MKAAARQFIERYLGANDLMAVVTTGGSTSGAQEFTSRKRLLLAAVDKFAGRKLESATLMRTEALQIGVGCHGTDASTTPRMRSAATTRGRR